MITLPARLAILKQVAGEIEGFSFKPFTPPTDINGNIVEPTRRDKIDEWLGHGESPQKQRIRSQL